MSNQAKSSVIVELYDLTITERKDDRFGRVVTTKSLTIDDLVTIAVNRRTDLSATTLKASMNILQEIAIEQIANGASVNFGLAHFNLTVNGVFVGDNAKWDPALHCLTVNTTPTSSLREAVKGSNVDVRGMAASGLTINSLTDVTTGKINSQLSPGGGVTITGSKIKIEGSDPNVGITLINQANLEITTIPSTSLVVNDPSQVSFIVPATLSKGDYKLSICTQYSPSLRTLKAARTSVFDYVLIVGQEINY